MGAEGGDHPEKVEHPGKVAAAKPAAQAAAKPVATQSRARSAERAAPTGSAEAARDQRTAAAPAATPSSLQVNSAATTAPMDILGIRLGATHAQVLAALDKLEPKFQVESFYNAISEEVQPTPRNARADTPGAFVLSMSAISTKPGTDRVTISFASPPNDNRVVDVSREQSFFDPSPENGLSAAVLWKALEDKYGRASEKGQAGTLGMDGKWLYPPGATDCLPAPGYWNAMNNDMLPQQCASALVVQSIEGRDGLTAKVTSRLANPRVVKDCYDRFIENLKFLRSERERKQLEKAKARPQL